MYELWNAVKACVWIASRDEAQVAKLKEKHTFIELGLETELAWHDIDDPEALPPLPGWIGPTQEELLGACVEGRIKLLGVPSSGGASQEIPGPACAVAQFFIESLDQGECLGPPGAPPGKYWTHLRILADDMRRVWPADSSVDAASSPSTPANPQPSPAEGEQRENFEQKAETKRAPRKRGAKRFQRTAVRDHLNARYPDGVTDGVSAESIQVALKAQGKAVSIRTIRRAMGSK
jgi:hypothetical protein